MHLPGVSIRATHDIKFISIIQNFTKRCKRKTVSFYFGLCFKVGAASYMQAIIARFGLPISVAQGTALVSAQEKMYFARGVPLKTGAKELLVYLKQKGYLIALASSSVRARALEALSQHGIASYFDAMVFGAEVARGKPHPDIFCKACDKLHAAPEDCLVLEDSEAGIQSAFSAHIPVICIPDMRQPGTAFQDMAQAVLPILTDVIDYLERRCC